MKRQVVCQQNMLTELVKYFLEAEDELNNTLVENLIKQSNESLLDPVEEPDNSSGATTVNSSKIFDSISNKARVHFAPNICELLNMIEHQSQQDDESLDVSVELKNELGMCLEKLKQEANAILALSSQPKKCDAETFSSEQDVEARLQSVTKQLLFEKQRNSQWVHLWLTNAVNVCFHFRLKSELFDSNQIVASLEKEKECLEIRVEQLLERVNMLETDLLQAKTRIADLIEGRNSEVVSEGYGEAGSSMMQGLGSTKMSPKRYKKLIFLDMEQMIQQQPWPLSKRKPRLCWCSPEPVWIPTFCNWSRNCAEWVKLLKRKPKMNPRICCNRWINLDLLFN